MSRKFYIKDDFFNVIDNELNAYILGFLYADGYHNTKKNYIALSLHEKDKQILDRIMQAIQPGRSLQYIKRKTSNPQYRITLYSKQISNRLLELGCTNNKTFTLTFPSTLIPNNLLHHFVRGYFDGDGCVSVYRTKENYFKCYYSIIGTLTFINELETILINLGLINKTKHIIRFPERNNNIVSLTKTGAKQCNKFADWLYKDSSIFLERKKEKFETIKNNTKTYYEC